MQSIKLKSDKTIKIGSDTYKPYTVGDLPPSFGYIAQKNRYGEIKEGISVFLILRVMNTQSTKLAREKEFKRASVIKL